MAKKRFVRAAVIAALGLAFASYGGQSSNKSFAAAEQLGRFSLPGFPHTIDAYQIDNADWVIVILHGGGGRNYKIAHSLGLNREPAPASQDSIDWSWLHERHVLAILPQGQAIDSEPMAYTWDNHVMLSGVDDMAFLQALAIHIRGSYGLSKVHVMGHSNGGMMVNRLRCEAPSTFDGYIAIAGPASARYLSTPCVPSVEQPYYGVLGDEDDVLHIDGNWTVATWALDPVIVLAADSAFVETTLIGEWQQQQRAQNLCAAPPQLDAAVTDGNIDTWSSCSGRLRLQRVRQASHSIDSLQEAAGARMIDLVADFISALP